MCMKAFLPWIALSLHLRIGWKTHEYNKDNAIKKLRDIFNLYLLIVIL